MTIRPIDMQVLIPHATDVGKAQHHANQQTMTQQQQFAEQLQQTNERRQKQVQGSNKSEGSKIKRDNRQEEKRQSKGGNEQERKKESLLPEEANAANNAKDPLRGRCIDIKT